MLPFLTANAERLGRTRDLIIVLGTFNYLVGFAVVASYSTWKGFGITRAFDSQYMVAGLIPTANIIAIFLLVAVSFHEEMRLRETVDKAVLTRRAVLKARGKHLSIWKDIFLMNGIFPAVFRTFWVHSPVFRWGMATSLVCLVAWAGLEFFNSTGEPITDLLYWCALSAGFVGSATLLFPTLFMPVLAYRTIYANPAIVDGRLSWWLSKYMTSGIFAFLVIAGMFIGAGVFYVRFIYPSIPIDLGGAEERCVEVVFKDEGLKRVVADSSLWKPASLKENVFRMTLKLSADPYVLWRDGRIWLVPRDEVRAMRTCPEPARYTVFFDWDSDDASSSIFAENVIRNAANAFKASGTVIRLYGHTDTAVPKEVVALISEYHFAIASRRALGVKAALMQEGVPPSAIHAGSWGTARPLVRTGPSIREPRNRRVEIVVE